MLCADIKGIERQMLELIKPKAAIVDYGVGNLFSVKHACEKVGLEAVITFSKQEILNADGVILPGVGAFGDAMESLKRLDLVGVLKEVAESSKPLIGICLGMHLLMTESHEFGYCQGLDVIKGSVIRFTNPPDALWKKLKVPHVGWNRIYRSSVKVNGKAWMNSALEGLKDGEFMYFVHSFYVVPEDPGVVLSKTSYGQIEFCSSFQYKNILAFQFHPERSGVRGLNIYEKINHLIIMEKGCLGK